jgi:type IV secretory pathway protease TraF
VVNVPATVVPGATVPSSAPSVAPSAVLPAPVSTVNLAQAIAVSGVVQAGSQTSVIVQVPNETTSRSAVVGDYLANGKVLVKRIEMQGAEPVVVLEQDGAEFVKPVGPGSLGTL